jgi:hypothetical protein
LQSIIWRRTESEDRLSDSDLADVVVDDVNVELDVVTGLVVVATEVAVEMSIENVSKEAVVVKAGGQEVPSVQSLG